MQQDLIRETPRRRQLSTISEPFYRLFRNPNRRAALDYHDQRDVAHTRGFLLYYFMENVLGYLNELGIHVRQQHRTFTSHVVDQRRAQLSLHTYPTVRLLDQRLNRSSVPLAAYRALLTDAFPAYAFEVIDALHVADRCPVLVLLDASAQDFADDGILAGELCAHEAPDILCFSDRSLTPVSWVTDGARLTPMLTDHS